MFLLMQASSGGAKELASHVAEIPGVVDAQVTSGPYDVIGRVDVGGPVAARSVVEAVRTSRRLTRLAVCSPMGTGL